MKQLLALLLAVFIAACAYRPISEAAFLGHENISFSCEIKASDVENTVDLAELFIDFLQNRMHKNVVSKEASSLHIDLKLLSLDFETIYLNEFSFSAGYKVTAKLEFKSSEDSDASTVTSGSYSFSASSEGSISSLARTNAIKEAIKEAMDSYAAQLAIKGS